MKPIVTRERRRHLRMTLKEPVTLYWEENGTNLCARGRCVNISESGVQIEAESLYRAFPTRTKIRFQIESLKLSGTATVRHARRRNRKMIIGLEFCGGLSFKPAKENLESAELAAVL